MACHYALMNNLYAGTMPGRMPRAGAARLVASLFLGGLRDVSHEAGAHPARPRVASA